MKSLFFWHGRLGRAQFFACGLGIGFGSMIISRLLFGIMSVSDSSIALSAAYILSIVIQVLVVYISICCTVRRIHDLNKPGWYYFVFAASMFAILQAGDHIHDAFRYIGFAFAMFGLTALYFFKGTVGDNDYGPDPLATSPLDIQKDLEDPQGQEGQEDQEAKASE